MPEQLATPKNFQEKMMDRIRESMGDLLTDEELKKLIDAAMQKVFFERKPKLDYYRNVTGEEPAMLEIIVKELLEETVRKEAREWVMIHMGTVMEYVERAVRDGMGKLFMEAITNQFAGVLMNMRTQVENEFVRRPNT